MSFSPWKSSRPAVTSRPALCGSEPPARQRCPAVRKRERRQKHQDLHQSACKSAAQTQNQSKGERETQQERSVLKNCIDELISC